MVKDYITSLQMIEFLAPGTDLYNWHLARLEWLERQIEGVFDGQTGLKAPSGLDQDSGSIPDSST